MLLISFSFRDFRSRGKLGAAVAAAVKKMRPDRVDPVNGGERPLGLVEEALVDQPRLFLGGDVDVAGRQQEHL
ncbi:MAG TPA: hypothetical protein VFJ53_01775, partial [Solirubrobacterales bacterium]|nr:hypothetical protein [Solirubrobacterales bacterium]